MGRIEGDDCFGTAGKSVDRKAAGESKAVEYRAIARERGEKCPAVALIEEEAGFLPVLHIDEKFVAMLFDLN